MIQRFRKEKDPLDDLIAELQDRMNAYGPESDKYPDLLAKLEKLHKLKSEKTKKPVSADTIWLCVTNLAGILAIVAYEQKHVMTSQGFRSLIRPTPNQGN